MDMTAIELMHDLRMPLQIIYSSAQLVRLSLDDPALDARRYADMLIDSVEQLNRMLSGAMTSCGRALRQAPPNFAVVDIAACLRGLCLRCRAHADERGVALRCSGSVDSLAISTDEDMLSRIVLNLISNALKATAPGGRIDVCWTARGDFVEVAVSDDGCGIAPERLPYVFLAGETAGGHGYGLPSARDCARALGGDVTARSEPGAGSTFTLRLPVRSSMAS